MFENIRYITYPKQPKPAKPRSLYIIEDELLPILQDAGDNRVRLIASITHKHWKDVIRVEIADFNGIGVDTTEQLDKIGFTVVAVLTGVGADRLAYLFLNYKE